MIKRVGSIVYKHQEEWYQQAEQLRRFFPRNEEMFGGWIISQTHSSLRFQGEYYLGDYTNNPDDVAFFTLIFPKDPEKDFTIQFNNRRSRDLANKYCIRSYLKAEISESLFSMHSYNSFLLSASNLLRYE